MTGAGSVGKDKKVQYMVPALKGQVICGKPGPGEKYKTVCPPLGLKRTHRKKRDENQGIRR